MNTERSDLANFPLVDPHAIERLSHELHGSAEIASRFLGDFTDNWQRRLDRLGTALSRGDGEDAYVTLLSIRTTSQMVGALRLAAVARKLQEHARHGRLQVCRDALPTLNSVGEQTVAALREV